MDFEFKKLSDVNSIEAMKEGLNILAEDNGEIVKVQTPYYGITIQFIDGSELMPGLLTYQAPYSMAEIVDWLRNAINQKTEFVRLNLKPDGSATTLYQTGFEIINLGEGNYNARVYFGKDVCPIILDTVENKMIFDPDWTADVGGGSGSVVVTQDSRSNGVGSYSCNMSFLEAAEAIKAGAPVVYVDATDAPNRYYYCNSIGVNMSIYEEYMDEAYITFNVYDVTSNAIDCILNFTPDGVVKENNGPM